MIANKGKGDNRLHISNRFLIVLILTIIGMALALPSFALADDVWTNVGLTDSNVKAINISPNYAKDYTMFAGTASNGVYRSTNKGHDWTQVNTGLTNLNVRSVAVSLEFATDHTVFAGTAGGVFVSTNAGDSWSAINTGLSSLDIRSVIVSPNYTTDHTVFAGTAGGIFKTSNGGSTWIAINSGLTNTDVRTIAVSPNFSVDNIVYVGTYGGGIYRSNNGGTSWVQINTGLSNLLITDIAISLDFPTDNTVFIGTYGGGVFKTTNRGDAWTQMNSGISSTDRYILAVAISPGYTRSKDDTVFAGTNGGVYKTTDAGTSWNQVNNGLMHKLIPSIDPTPCYCLDKTVYAGSDGGGVYSCVFSSGSVGPETHLSISNPAYPNGDDDWFKTVPTISLACSTLGTTKYQWDSTSGAWTTYTGDFQAIEGQHTLYYYSIDTTGNVEAYKSQAFKVDSGLPNDPTVTSPSHTAGSTSSDNTIDITISGASDAVSGVDGYSIQWSNSATTLPDRTVDITGTTASFSSSQLADGIWYVHISTKDKAGNWTSTAHLGPFTVDAASPTTTLSTVPSYSGGWVNAQPSITLAHSEAGITYYQWDSTATAGWQTYSASFAAMTGQHTLYYYSKDTAGNSEAYKNQTFKIDMTPPPAFSLVSPANGNNADNISLPAFSWGSSNDTESGTAKYRLFIDGKQDKEVTSSELSCSSSTILTQGPHTWFVRAIDAADNTRDTSSFTLNVIDKIAPVTQMSTSPSYSGAWVKTSPSISFSRNETGTTYYQWDSTAPAGFKPYSTSLTAAAGTHILYYQSVDLANNTETVKSATFNIDASTPSSVPLGTPEDGTSTTNAIYPTFTWTAASDTGSGVAKYQVYIDGSLKTETSASQLSYTLTAPLSSGSHNWTVKAVDGAGNTGSSSTNSFTVVDKVPPVSSVSSSPSYANGTNGWFKTAPVINISENEPGTIYYQWDSTAPAGFKPFTGTFTAPEGQSTLYYYSVDSAGNIETYKSQTYNVDTGAPASFAMSGPADGSSIDNASYPTFSWLATSDTGLSGLSKYQLFVDGLLKKDKISLSATSYTLTTTLSPGTHTWYIRAVDAAGNTRDANGGTSYTIIVKDVVPPVTSLSTSPSYPNGTNGWYKTAPTVVLSKNEAGTTSYQIDAGGELIYTGSFTIPEGKHTLTYYSYDTSSNTEITKSKTFNVDVVAPTSFDINAPTDGSFTNNASYPTFSWSASSDAGSGLSKYQLFVDGLLKKDNISPSATSYTVTMPLTPGIHTWFIRAVDTAGNTISSSSTFTLNVTDVVPPVTTLSSSPSYPNGTNGWFKTMPAITLTRNEPGTTRYQIDSTNPGGWQLYSDHVPVSDGQFTLYYYSLDSATNTETVKSKSYKIDTVYPTAFDIITPGNLSGSDNSVRQQFTWEASTDTNLAKYQLVVDGNVNKDNISPSSTSYTVTTPLSADTHTWYINAVDSAGNITQSTSTNTIIVGDKVAPVTSLSVSPVYPDGTNSWYETTPTVTLTRSEPGKTYYHWDSSADTEVLASTVSFTVPEGQHTLYYRSEDSAQNPEVIKSKSFKLDTTAPASFAMTGPADNSDTNNTSYPTFTWAASTDTNLAKYQLVIDGTINKDNISPSSTSYTVTTPLSADTHTWYINAVDSAGNITKSTSTFTLNVADVIPPMTTLSTSPTFADGASGWFKTAPDISLTRNEPGATEFQWDSSGWQTYATGSITATQGKHTLYYRSLDTANNAETVKSKAFNVDTSAPDVFDITAPANNASTNNASYPTFTWNASNDSVSGISKYQLVVDGIVNKDNISPSATSYTVTTPLSADTHTWYINAVDSAGNVKKSTSTFTINVDDATPPVTTLSTNPIYPDGSNGWFKSMPSIMLMRNEPGTTKYQWDSTATASWLYYDAATSGFRPLEGQHTLYFYSVDTVPNTEIIRSQVLKMDLSVPSVSVAAPLNGARLTVESTTISGTAIDTGGSGISKVEIFISDTNTWRSVTGTTSWSYNWTVPSDGSYTIKARVTDMAGNVSSETTLNVTADKAAPYVKSYGPTGTGLNVGTNITAIFSEDIDPTSVNNTTFEVKDGNNNTVQGTVSYDQASKTATFYPSSLVYNTTYTVTIAGVKDLAGTSLSPAASWSFSTKFANTPVTSLTVTPPYPDGTDGWYKSKPQISLQSDQPGTTYYQWDSGALETYVDPAIADVPEGSYTLSYFSVSANGTESVTNSRSFSVDLTKPDAPTNTVATAMSPTSVKVTWDTPADNVDVAKYSLSYKPTSGSTQTVSGISTNSYTINGLTSDTTYTCSVVAYDAAGNASNPGAAASAKTYPNVPTGSGTNVQVTVGIIDLTFTKITQPGTTTVVTITDPPYGGPEDNFRIRGYVFDVDTKATFTGDVTVTVHYDPTLINGNPKNLKLRHWNGSKWEDITVSVDTVSHTITGITKSLSPIDAWLGPDYASGSTVAYGMNTDLLLAFSLSLMISGAWLMLRRRSTA
ncbi:MAG: Ig-like domain-containing protein [Candidatus Aquicultor sp.]